MRIYETTFIVNPQADDAAIDRQVTAVLDLVKKNGGEIVHEDRMGTRRLAYPIEGLTQGYYASIIFNASIDVLPLLERHYKLEEPYVRYLTIRYEGDIQRSAGDSEEKAVAAALPDSEAPRPESAAKTDSLVEKEEGGAESPGIETPLRDVPDEEAKPVPEEPGPKTPESSLPHEEL